MISATPVASMPLLRKASEATATIRCRVFAVSAFDFLIGSPHGPPEHTTF
jgi:hypothetical protein